MKAILIALSLLYAAPVFAQTETPEPAVEVSVTAEQEEAAQKSQEGQRLMKQKKYTAARDAFMEATRNDPDRAEYHQLYGAALLKSGDAFSAAEELQIAIDLGVNDASAWDALGKAHEKTKRYLDAEDAFKEAAERGSKTGLKDYKRMKALQAAAETRAQNAKKPQPSLLKCSRSSDTIINPFEKR